MTSFLRVGYRCIQDYPNRICSGCTSGCAEPVFIEDDSPIVMKDGSVLTDADIEALADEAERGYCLCGGSGLRLDIDCEHRRQTISLDN